MYPADQQHHQQRKPGKRIGEVDQTNGHGGRVDEGDPRQAEGAGAQQVDDHRKHRTAAAADGTGEHVRQTEDDIGRRHDAQALYAGHQHVRLLIVYPQQRLAEDAGHGAEERAGDHDAEKALVQNGLYTVVFSGADVLAQEGLHRLVEGVHGHINEAVDAAGSAAASHHNAAVGVDGALNDHVGNAEKAALNAGGHAYLGHEGKTAAVKPKPTPGKAQGVLRAHKTQQHQYGAESLADDRGQRHPRHVHVERNDEQQVQRHVHHAAGGEEKQGALGVAAGAQGGGAVVIQHDGRRAGKVDIQVRQCQVDDVIRRGNRLQNPLGRGAADAAQQNAANDGHEHRRVDGGGDLPVLIALADIAGDDHVHAHGHADEQVYHQIDDGRGAAHGGKAGVVCVASQHHHVRRIEQKLQHAGGHERQAEEQYFFQQRPCEHVDGAAEVYFHSFHKLSTGAGCAAAGLPCSFPLAPKFSDAAAPYGKTTGRRCSVYSIIVTMSKKLKRNQTRKMHKSLTGRTPSGHALFISSAGLVGAAVTGATYPRFPPPRRAHSPRTGG